ncbi:MAG: cytochrome c3 family protein [Myxococcota bacterium]
MSKRFLVCASLLALALLIGFSACVNPRKGYAPSQPVEFSHKLHAGQNEIACRYCHVGNGEGPSSVVPGVNTCMNCHNEVQGRTAQGKENLKKVRAAWREGKPIRWKKVHDMPDHVRFSHQPHIVAGVDCADCHGDVETMEVVSTQNAFNMGWCVNCHREPENNASVDCAVCHY